MTEPSFRYSPISNKIRDVNTTVNTPNFAFYNHKTQDLPHNDKPISKVGVPFDNQNSNHLNVPDTHAPLARLETLDDKDDREVVSKPYPGVDDGFFTDNNDLDKPTEKDIDSDVELLPREKDPEKTDSNNGDHPIIPRAGPNDNGQGDSDENDGFHPVSKDNPHPHYPKFPVAPGFGFPDLEHGIGVGSGIGETIPDLNVYQHKKTLAQGMMDLALFSANSNQLRYVLETFKNHPYFYPSLVLITISLFLQVAVGIGLIWNATYNVKNEADLCRANKINNFTVIAIFLVTVINVFISAFGVAPETA